MEESRAGGRSLTHWCLWIRRPLAWLQPLTLVVVPCAETTAIQGHPHASHSSAASTDSGSARKNNVTQAFCRNTQHMQKKWPPATRGGQRSADESERKTSTDGGLGGFFQHRYRDKNTAIVEVHRKEEAELPLWPWRKFSWLLSHWEMFLPACCCSEGRCGLSYTLGWRPLLMKSRQSAGVKMVCSRV